MAPIEIFNKIIQYPFIDADVLGSYKFDMAENFITIRSISIINHDDMLDLVNTLLNGLDYDIEEDQRMLTIIIKKR